MQPDTNYRDEKKIEKENTIRNIYNQKLISHYSNRNNHHPLDTKLPNEINMNDEKNKKGLINDNLIINNLEHELREKNNEIKLIKKNFLEKIDLVENENKVILYQIEEEFNKVNTLMKTKYEENLNGLQVNSLEVKNNYDDLIAKLSAVILDLKNKTIDSKKHEKLIQDIKTKSFLRIEEEKNIYNERLRELIYHFDKPDYRKLIQNISFYLKFKEKINFTDDDLNYIEKFNFTNQEYDLWMDRIKLNLITAECDYIKGVMNLENNYRELHEKIKFDEEEKFKMIENEILEKFDVFIF